MTEGTATVRTEMEEDIKHHTVERKDDPEPHTIHGNATALEADRGHRLPSPRSSGGSMMRGAP